MTAHHLMPELGQKFMAHVRDCCASLYLLVNCPTDLLCSCKALPAGIMLAFVPEVVQSYGVSFVYF